MGALDMRDRLAVMGATLGGATTGYVVVVVSGPYTLAQLLVAVALQTVGFAAMLLAVLRPINTDRRWLMPTVGLSAFLAFIAVVGVAGVVAAGPLAGSAVAWIAVGLAVVGIPLGVYVHRDQVKRFGAIP